MREIDLCGKSLAQFKTGDVLQLPRRSYFVEGTASGGMGFVVFATLTDDSTNSLVSNLPSRLALKISKSPTDSLENELQKWSLMTHENILLLEEILYSKIDGPVAVSRRCPGSLSTLLYQESRFSEEAAYAVVRSCAEALADAFENHGVVHLDIKPDNVLFKDRTKDIKYFKFYVSDWGISSTKISDTMRSKEHVFQETNNNAGTIPYMAPERFVRGWKSSPISDIFSLGILWLELVSGRLPYSPGSNLVPQIISGNYFTNASKLLKPGHPPPPPPI